MKDSNDAFRKLSLLANSIVDDMMKLSDHEFLTELKSDGIDVEVLAKSATIIINKAKIDGGKASMAAAKTAYSTSQAQKTTGLLRLTPAQKRELFSKFLAKDGPLKDKLTLAARNGSHLSDEEIDGILGNLLDLGAIDKNGNLQ